MSSHNVHDDPEVKAAMRAAVAASRKPSSECAARCGVPLDPVLTAQGWTMHPSCEFPATRITPADHAAHLHLLGRLKRQRGAPAKGTTWWRPKAPGEPVPAEPEKPSKPTSASRSGLLRQPTQTRKKAK